MPTTHLAHRLLLVSLAVIVAVVLVGVTTLGGSQAQTPGTPTPIPTPVLQPNVAATATYVAMLQRLANQQVPGTPTTVLPNATATYAAILQNLQNQLPSGTPTPITAAPINTTSTAASGATAADACGLSLANASGGQTVGFEQVELTLPAGDYVYGFIRPESGQQPALVVCSMQTNSTIYFDARSGQETARRANGEAGNTALNQLRGLVRTRTSQVAGVTGSSVTPPNTGDGGLR
ncbi:MAG TPA: hypothetical protein VJB57_13925 [Dehalococcoidia bacterium]|nr:hypothetical protein [Dehalococcoidia bacterium]